MSEPWEMDATSPNAYFDIEVERGREFILRLTTGADIFKAIQQFAIDKGIRFAKIHAAFMGGLQPAKFLVWAPDTRDPENWHNESEYTLDNLSMLLALGGMIHPRPKIGGEPGEEEPFPAIHFVTGGSWNAPTIGGHMNEGTIVKGVVELYITEIKGIEVVYPQDWLSGKRPDLFPENWYKNV